MVVLGLLDTDDVDDDNNDDDDDVKDDVSHDPMSCSLNSSNRGGGKEDCVSINRVDCVWMDILLGDDDDDTDDDTDSAVAEDDLNAETP